MAQGSQQFTPQQILEAGRRAESEGRVEYAIQFYRHLTDHLGRTAEAVTAREALARLGALPASAPNASNSAGAPAKINGHPFTAPVVQPAASTQPAAATAAPTAAAAPRPSPPQPVTVAGSGAVTVRPAPAAIAAADVQPKRRLMLPRSRRRYRTGRFVARAVTFLGFFEIAIGCFLIVLGIAGRVGTAGSALGEFAATQQIVGTAAGLTVIAIGLFQVLAGQLARAAFDIASSSRDIAAFNRARFVYEGAVPEEPPAQEGTAAEP